MCFLTKKKKSYLRILKPIYSIFSAGAAQAKSAESPTKSQLKITDLKDFNKLTSKKGEMSQSSSNNSLSKSSPSFEDPFDTDNISYLNGSENQTQTLVCDRLPEPIEFGDGNPFLMFVCISCLLQHRNQIINGRFDYQEIAMFFDKMVRKHDVNKTLTLARKLFAEYLNDDWSEPQNHTKEEEAKASAC